ncbi:fumarate reductase cytochrome b subunit [Congregibacter variabilis]|uniref:Fumarate reductase cytochrome b subunit n=1 Tax=Congregibacter variabilis TaxID=3081200 RepID=A0ABZ0I7P6_9GAMM|nr:fumarate reductase cytochrome b subunit [Congregibacter sp. IMCC43200]
MLALSDKRWPAWLDLVQGLTGLLLVLFMWAHLFAVSSILLGKSAMFRVTRFFEGSLFFDTPQPWLVSLVALTIFVLFAVHTVLAIRKMPDGYRQWRAWLVHMRGMRHEETTLWLLQVLTGLVLMFFATAHLLELFIHPANIGPHASSARIADGGWVLGLILLFSVEVHAGIGLYRLIIKWGWFGLGDSVRKRQRLRRVVYGLVTFFLVLGLATQQAYLRIGEEEAVRAGVRYDPTAIEASH